VNHYPLNVFWSEEDGGFIAEAPDLPGCSAFGETEADAAAEARHAIVAWLEAAKAAGRPIPEASVVEPVGGYSGKFVLRIPRSLHARLARQAKAEGVSLNQYIAHRLSG